MVYSFIGILDGFVSVITGFKIYTLSRHPTYSKQARFHFERNWFWIYIKLSLVIVITWSFQFLAIMNKFNLFLYIIVDTILLLTTITITIIVLGRKKVIDTAFGKYTEISTENVEKSEEKINNEIVKV